MILQHIIPALFTAQLGLASGMNTSQRKASEHYFNLFSPPLWDCATQKDLNYYCHLHCHGNGTLEINAVQEDGSVFGFVKRRVMGEESLKIKLPGKALYYYVSLSKELTLDEGYFGCEESALPADPALRICLITVTYRRPQDIARLYESYRRFKSQPAYRPLAGCLDMLIVNNNGEEPLHLTHNSCHSLYVSEGKLGPQALSSAYPTDLTILNSRNTGGSGGFIRGMRHALSHSPYTHVLLCDDDAALHPETLYRTLALLTLRNTASKVTAVSPCIISGAMFEKEHPHYCHCVFERLNHRAHHRSILGNCALNSEPDSIKNLLLKLKEALTGDSLFPDQYAAWWYCCLPAALIREHGLPLQFFIRGDDQEYGLRLKAKIVTLNGIHIWHPDFRQKRTPFRAYLGNRNYVLINLLHYRSYLNNISVHFAVKAWRAFKSHDRESLALLSLSLEDALNFDNTELDYATLQHRVEEGKHRGTLSSLVSLIKSLLTLASKGTRLKQALYKVISS